MRNNFVNCLQAFPVARFPVAGSSGQYPAHSPSCSSPPPTSPLPRFLSLQPTPPTLRNMFSSDLREREPKKIKIEMTSPTRPKKEPKEPRSDKRKRNSIRDSTKSSNPSSNDNNPPTRATAYGAACLRGLPGWVKCLFLPLTAVCWTACWSVRGNSTIRIAKWVMTTTMTAVTTSAVTYQTTKWLGDPGWKCQTGPPPLPATPAPPKISDHYRDWYNKYKKPNRRNKTKASAYQQEWNPPILPVPEPFISERFKDQVNHTRYKQAQTPVPDPKTTTTEPPTPPIAEEQPPTQTPPAPPTEPTEKKGNASSSTSTTFNWITLWDTLRETCIWLTFTSNVAAFSYYQGRRSASKKKKGTQKNTVESEFEL